MGINDLKKKYELKDIVKGDSIFCATGITSGELVCGETLGKNNGPEIDIAVDPLEGTNFAANNLPGALSVIAVTHKNNLLHAPETYMNKIAYGSNVEKGVIDLDYSIKKNIHNLSEYLNKKPENMSACILDRPRHSSIIEELKNLKVKLKFFFIN